jgi:hypothetical protein
MLIQETFINKTEGHGIGDSDKYEPFTDNIGQLFRSLQREYGRCVGKVYQDTPDGTKQTGWVFEGMDKYTDTGDKYLREVWVTLYEKADTVERTEFPLYLNN